MDKELLRLEAAAWAAWDVADAAANAAKAAWVAADAAAWVAWDVAWDAFEQYKEDAAKTKRNQQL